MERKVRIGGEKYVIRYSLRMFFVYERIKGEYYKGGSLLDMYILCYSCLLGNNPDTFALGFDGFIDECDKDEGIMGAFSAMLEDYARVHSISTDDDKKKEGKQ